VLFDLRDPRRRAAIKVIYGTLAVLMGGGLIFFGIGSDAQGGLSEIFGGGGGSANEAFEDQINEAEDQVDAQPCNEQALLSLVTLNVQAGGQQAEGIDEATGYPILSTDSEDSYAQAAEAWARYLRCKPKNPDDGAALQLADAYFVSAVNAGSAAEAQTDLENAAEVQQVAVDANPIVGNLNRLATYLFLAGRFEQAQQVVDELIAKNPKQANAIRKQFEQLEEQGRSFQKQVEAEAKGAGAGGNPLEEPGALGGGSSLSTP
jgi:tetratricopeptide (TPR) repeat protein